MDKNNRHSTQDNKEVKQLLTETMLEDMKVIPKELFRHAEGKKHSKSSEQGQSQSGHGEGETHGKASKQKTEVIF